MLQANTRLFERSTGNFTHRNGIPMISQLAFRRFGGVSIALLTAILMSACQTSGSNSDPEPQDSIGASAGSPTGSAAAIQNGAEEQNKFLLGVDWGIVELDGNRDESEIRGMGGSAVFIHLDSGAAFGHAGCNRFNAQYNLDGNSLTFGPAAMTKMYCEGLMEIESGVARVLDETDSYSIQGDTLSLLNGSKVLAKLVQIAQ